MQWFQLSSLRRYPFLALESRRRASDGEDEGFFLYRKNVMGEESVDLIDKGYENEAAIDKGDSVAALLELYPDIIVRSNR